MSDYTVIVDDNDSQITYEPGEDSWRRFVGSFAYQGSLHRAESTTANMTFSFIGGRKVVVRGNFVGKNDHSDSTRYPILQVDSKSLHCTPKTPQNGGQFLCSTKSLSLEVTNRTLTMFVDPSAGTQQVHIDYIRYGSNSQAAQTMEGAVVFAQSPDNSTPGLSFKGNWQKIQSLGAATNDIKSITQTSTTSSKATYRFVGDTFAWWSCCMPSGTPRDAANVTYTIDGGDAVSLQIDGQFIQGPQCIDEHVLFQTRSGDLKPGNHTVEVTYNGDNTTMPLTLCALAATPPEFSTLDALPSGATQPLPSPTVALSTTSTPSNLPSHRPDTIHDDLSNQTMLVVGIVSTGAAIALIILVVSIIWWRRKRNKRCVKEKRSSSTDSLLPFAFHPVVGFIDTDKRSSAVVEPLPESATAPSDSESNTQTVSHISIEQGDHNGSRHTETPSNPSQVESRPPSYRTGGSLLNV